MKNSIALLIASAALVPSALAIVVEGPSVQVTIDGKTQTLTPRQDPEKKTWSFGENGTSLVVDNEYSINITGTFDPDPSIAYGLAVVDFGAPSTFSFTFFTPIVSTGPATLVDASISGAFTDSKGNGVSATPTGLNTTLQRSLVSAPLTSMGVDVGPAFSGGPGSSGALYTYGAFASGPIAGPAGGPWTGLQIENSFALSGDGDIAVFTGFSQVVDAPPSVPEGGVGFLGLLSMLIVPAISRYSRRS